MSNKKPSLTAGMTLIEIMAVVLLLGLVAAVFATSNYFLRIRYVNLNTACRKLASFITEAQAQSVLGGKEITLVLDLDEQNYYFEEAGADELDEHSPNRRELPSGILFTDVYTSSFESELFGQVRIRFRRDGYVEPYVIHIGTDQTEKDPLLYTIKISPLTGFVEIFKEDLGWDDLME